MDNTNSQASRIIAKFGSPYKLAAALADIGHRITVMTIYRWTYPRPRGTGGYIPGEHVSAIQGAALVCDVNLSAADWDPR